MKKTKTAGKKAASLASNEEEILDFGTAEKTAKKMSTPRKRVKLGPVRHRLIRDMSNEAYHGSEGTWSSSQLKTILEDEELFVKKYIKKEVEKEEREAFDTGTYFHTGVLEPHKMSSEVAIFPGKARYGKAWDDFKNANKGKLIVSSKQAEEGDGMIEVVKSSPIAMGFLKGEPEVSLYTDLLIVGIDIYAPFYGKVLTPDGWEKVDKIPPKDSGFTITIRVRADCLGDTFVSDLKSTSGRANQMGSVRGSISKYLYDLSAALYLDMFSLIREDVTAFLWVFASKKAPVAATWKATDNQIRVGRAKWSWAVRRIADLAAANWEIPDYLREAEPLPHELEWLKTKDSELL